MSVESMAGLYLTFGIICILSILLFIWQKRFIMKNNLLTLVRGKNLLEGKKVSSVTYSIENSSEHSSVSQRDVHTIIHL
jgi:hypothetical protein